MSELPSNGIYRISYQSYTATVLDGQNVLRGEPIDGDIYRWDVYVRDGSKCTLRDSNGQGYLRVDSLKNHQEVRLGEPQEWILQKTGDGYTIGQIAGEDLWYFWHFSGDGEPIRIVYDRPVQSWVFEKQPKN